MVTTLDIDDIDMEKLPQRWTKLCKDRAEHQYEVNRCLGLQATFIAALIAWISVLMIEMASNYSDFYLALLVAGTLTFLMAARSYRRSGNIDSQKIALIEAELLIIDKLKDNL